MSMFRPGIFLDTFQESFRNKMFLFFFIVASLIVGSIGLALNMDVVNGVMRGVTFFGSELRVPEFTVKQWAECFQAGLAMVIGTFGLFLALMATSALSSELYRRVFRSLYWVVPKTAETIGAMRRLITERPLEINWVVGTSFAFALVCYIATVIYFTRKDY